MTPMSQEIVEQISGAYKAMADEAHYRPAAPSDGMGHITVPENELNLKKEQTDYTHHWWEEEDMHSFHVGCCDFQTRPAVIFAVEAIRNLNAGVPVEPKAASNYWKWLFNK